MLQMTIRFHQKGDPPPYAGQTLTRIKDGVVELVAVEGGMSSGKPSLAFHLEMPEGGGVIFETSARLLVTAARAIVARYPDLCE